MPYLWIKPAITVLTFFNPAELTRLFTVVKLGGGSTLGPEYYKWVLWIRSFCRAVDRYGSGLCMLDMGKETMLFWARLRGLGKERAEEALSLVGLSDTGGKPVASFSKGMRQRVLFAQALLAKPPLIIMDEPTNGLDPYWMETFVGLVRKAAADGQTVLFSTHQLQIAEALADRILFLQGGRVVLDGKTDEIRSSYGAEGLGKAFGELFGLSLNRLPTSR